MSGVQEKRGVTRISLYRKCHDWDAEEVEKGRSQKSGLMWSCVGCWCQVEPVIMGPNGWLMYLMFTLRILTNHAIANYTGLSIWREIGLFLVPAIDSNIYNILLTTRVLLMITFARGSRWKWSTVLFSAGDHFQTLDCDISILWCHSYLAFRLLYISFYTTCICSRRMRYAM